MTRLGPAAPLLQWCRVCAAATPTEICPGCLGEVCARCGLVPWPDADPEEPGTCRPCLAAEYAESEE